MEMSTGMRDQSPARRPAKRSVNQSISRRGRWESHDFGNGVKNVERRKCVATRYVSVKVVSLAGRYWVSAGRYCRQHADTCCERILQTAEFKAGKYWMSF